MQKRPMLVHIQILSLLKHFPLTWTVDPVIIFTASALWPFLVSFSLKTTSHDLFLQLMPLVPLNVPHFGHFRTPRSVGLPKSPKSALNLSVVVAISGMERIVQINRRLFKINSFQHFYCHFICYNDWNLTSHYT